MTSFLTSWPLPTCLYITDEFAGPPPNQKNFPSFEGISVGGHGYYAACEMRQGILVLCLSAGSPARTDAATTVQTDISWLNVSPERIFSPFFPFALHLHKPTQLQHISADYKGKTLLCVFQQLSSFCWLFMFDFFLLLSCVTLGAWQALVGSN